ncbi:MAG: CRISPR-associated endonuclease Cas2 [Treponema sp.]|nr:CRISPR-associated endonuclease Cas2 [Treponema sp.]
MRILVLLNPTNKRGTKASYTELRKFLVKDGYILLQSEVFMRITNNRKGAEKHLNRIKNYIPDSGTVRILRLTEKQLYNMGLYQFEPDPQEEIVGINDFIAV